MTQRGYTTAEMMISALSREVVDGDLLGQGLGTQLSTAAYFLAKRTHAPQACLIYSAGCAFSYRTGPLRLTSIERLALGRPVRRATYTEIVCDTLPTVAFKEFSRPAQVDRLGNTNNMVIGPYAAPKVRLPGAGGIPDFSPYATHDSILYLPRHDRRAFVDGVDFRSGVGRLEGQDDEERRRLGVTGRGSHRLVTDLAIIDFTNDGPLLASVHPDVTPADVQAATGFELLVPADVAQTPPPSDEDLRLIREEIDPLGLRDLELATAKDRLGLIRELVAREQAVEARA